MKPVLGILAAAAVPLVMNCAEREDDRASAGGVSTVTESRDGGDSRPRVPGAEVRSDTGGAGTAAPPGSIRTVYVPAYSHIYHGDDRRVFPLTITLSVRNTDPGNALVVEGVRYYDDHGDLARTYLERPRRLGPMASVEFVVDEGDRSGGSGANFVVEWRSDGPISEPWIEAVMIGTSAAQGISFTSHGRPITRP